MSSMKPQSIDLNPRYVLFLLSFDWCVFLQVLIIARFHLQLLISLSRHSPPIEADSRHFYDFCANFFAYNLPIERTNAIDLREISYNKGKLVLQIRSGDFLRWKVCRILFFFFVCPLWWFKTNFNWKCLNFQQKVRQRSLLESLLQRLSRFK